MEQLRLNLTPESDDWYEFYCATCCEERKDKVKFYRVPGLIKMFGWDERLGYSCGGCGHVYFLSYLSIYDTNFIGGLIQTFKAAGWHPTDWFVYRWNTDFLDGGDVIFPADREAFEEQCKEKAAESDEISRRIKEKYG